MSKSFWLAPFASLSVISMFLFASASALAQGINPWDELRSRTQIPVLVPGFDSSYVETPFCMSFSASPEEYVMYYGADNSACESGGVRIGLRFWGETAPNLLELRDYLNVPLMGNSQPQQFEEVTLSDGTQAWFRVENCSQRCAYSIRWIYRGNLYGILGIGNENISENRSNFITMAEAALE